MIIRLPLHHLCRLGIAGINSVSICYDLIRQLASSCYTAESKEVHDENNRLQLHKDTYFYHLKVSSIKRTSRLCSLLSPLGNRFLIDEILSCSLLPFINASNLFVW